MKNFSINVSNDYTEATVLLDVRTTSALNAGAAVAELDPRQARKIAMDLLKAAEDAEDQAVHNARRAAGL
jgi:hypothetical protein